MKMKKIACAWVLSAAVTSAWAGGTLVFCTEASPVGFDAAQSTAVASFNASSYPVFDTLLAYKPGTTELMPSLAQKWDVSPDGKTYTFHLRPNVQFHTTDEFKPSRALQAEDVIFTFGRMIQKNHPSNRFYPAEYPYAVDMGLHSNIVSIKKIDALTVKFKLKQADAPFLSKLAVPFAVIHSVEYAQQLAKVGRLADLNQKPVGTGPFIFSSYAKDETIRYNANRAHWNPAAVKLDKLIFSIATDAAVRYQKLQKGECDLMGMPNPADLVEMRANPDLKVVTTEGLNVGYVAYNLEKPKLNQREVRLALDMAINRQALVAAAYGDQAVVASNPFPPSLWAYNTSLKNPPVDVAKAKALLAKAGYPMGFETEIWTTTLNKSWRTLAEMLQADWAKIGVKANIVTLEWGEYLKRLNQGDHSIALSSWTGDYADPENFLNVLLTCKAVGGSNHARYCSPEFDALVNQAGSLTNQAERTKLYEQAQVLFKHDLPWSTLSHAVKTQPLRKTVQGYSLSPFGGQDFRYVSKTQ